MAEKSEPEKEEEDHGGLFGPFRIGVLVGGGLPNVLSFGGMIKITRFLGGGVNIGLIPSVKLSLYGQAELSYQEYDAYGRLFPFGGDFFLGAGVGYATMKGTFKQSYNTSAYPGLPNPLIVTSQGSVRTMVLTPAIGLLHTFGIGLTLGADLGAQIPIAPSDANFHTDIPSTIPQAYRTQAQQFIGPNDQKVKDTLGTIGHTILPTFNLRIGWLL